MQSQATKHKSHLTAITRKTLPVPTRWLLKQGRITGHVLDYGCGKCAEVNQTMLACMLPKVKSVTSYDPHWEPLALAVSPRSKWDVVICNYVLCTLPREERIPVLKHIQMLLRLNGVAYITVRNDRPDQGWGVSKRGTYQGRVTGLPLELLHEERTFRIYRLTKETNLP